MTNVSKAMEYAATFEREAMREKLDAALGDLDHMSLIQLEAMTLLHKQQIKDLAAHLLELKQLVTPMMQFKPELRAIPWVGLTDAERDSCWLKVDSWSTCMFTLEKILREKNGG
jgi:hypothetical protein